MTQCCRIPITLAPWTEARKTGQNGGSERGQNDFQIVLTRFLVRASVDAVGFRTTLGWDVLNRNVSVQNPLGNIVTSVYLATGWRRAIVDPLGHRVTSSFDAAGHKVSVQDGNNNVVTTVFDPTGRAVAKVNALGFRLTSLFDAADRRTAQVDARGNRFSFGYSKADQPVTKTDPLSRVQTVVFDTASQPVVRIDARSFRVSQVFDNAGQIVGLRYPDGTRVSQVFDDVGNRRVLADSTGRYTTTFDALNREHAVENPALKTVTVTCDGASRRHTLTNPDGGVVTYSWSKRDQCTALQNADGDRTSWTFDAAGRQTVQLLANGVRVSLAYDAADRLVRLANLNSTGTTLSSFRDTWDNANNRVNRQEADGTLVSWSYDASYQLTRERRSGTTFAYDTTYSYDPAGNRVLKLDSGARTTITLDAANQLVKTVDSTGTTTCSFAATGNQRLEQAPSGITTNTWDYENRLTKVQLASGVVNTFTFSGDGQRVKTQDSSGTLKQVYDGQKVLLETDQTDATQVVYTTSPGFYGDLVSQKRLLVRYYHIFDPLGSTDRLASSAQAVTDTYIYKAFGEILLAGKTANLFRYVGREAYRYLPDLSHYGAGRRVVNSAVGRWLSVDPIPIVGLSSAYVYVRNNALTRIDPAGLQPVPLTPTPIPCSCDVLNFEPPPLWNLCHYYQNDPIPGGDLGDFFGAPFQVSAEFKPPACFCCEYRQYIRGTIQGKAIPGGIGKPWEVIENFDKYGGDAITVDGEIYHEDNKGGTEPAYGHRGCGMLFNEFGLISNTGADAYTDAPPSPSCYWGYFNRCLGCKYHMFDSPGVRPVRALFKGVNIIVCVKLDLHFVGRIIDTCNNNAVKATIQWSVACVGAIAKKPRPHTLPDTSDCGDEEE